MPDQPAAPPSLPPVPDPTGHPRPPAAPRITGPWTGRRTATAGHHRAEDQRSWPFGVDSPTERERRLRREHPMLEEVTGAVPTYADRLPTALLVGGVPVAQFVVVGGILALWSGTTEAVARNLPVLGWLLAGVFVVLFTVWMLGNRTPTRICAAARIVNARPTDLWLYELTAVTVRHRRHGPELRLSGRAVSFTKVGRVSLPLGLLESNPQLWDLVHNGIRHSVAAGARTDERTRELLGLPGP